MYVCVVENLINRIQPCDGCGTGSVSFTLDAKGCSKYYNCAEVMLHKTNLYLSTNAGFSKYSLDFTNAPAVSSTTAAVTAVEQPWCSTVPKVDTGVAGSFLLTFTNATDDKDYAGQFCFFSFGGRGGGGSGPVACSY